MSFEIDVLSEGAVICVVFFGLVTMAERFKAMEAIVTLHTQQGYSRLLVDFTKAQMLDTSTEDTNAYASRLARELPQHRMRIAYVGETSQTAGVEIVAALRGYFYRRFYTSAEALRWLA